MGRSAWILPYRGRVFSCSLGGYMPSGSVIVCVVLAFALGALLKVLLTCPSGDFGQCPLATGLPSLPIPLPSLTAVSYTHLTLPTIYSV